MKRTGYLLLLLIVGLAACKGTNKVVSATEGTKDVKKKVACAGVHINEEQPHLDWFPENASVFNDSKEVVVLPKEYKIYSVSPVQMQAFFNALDSDPTKELTTVIPLPKPADCQVFTVRKHEVAGSKPLPGVVLTMGKAKGQEMELDYKDGKMVAHVIWFGLTYEVYPVSNGSQTYYVVYEKQKVTNENNKPPVPEQKVKLEELKYDR